MYKKKRIVFTILLAAGVIITALWWRNRKRRIELEQKPYYLMSEEEIDATRAFVYCEFKNVDAVTDDHTSLIFTTEEGDINSIVRSDREGRGDVLPGEYVVLTTEDESFEPYPIVIDNADQEFHLTIDYAAKTIECYEITEKDQK